ncbi:unnamed protein product [Pleuronectes platessa]|uniref:Uncharacterized protein n=1 Tax=Pleuronectes platessa TaxID=8262 RepID=A0A9N7VBI2_PLEPL|nr:unnamed protein product [Pleuronectes platessa]
MCSHPPTTTAATTKEIARRQPPHSPKPRAPVTVHDSAASTNALVKRPRTLSFCFIHVDIGDLGGELSDFSATSPPPLQIHSHSPVRHRRTPAEPAPMVLK